MELLLDHLSDVRAALSEEFPYVEEKQQRISTGNWKLVIAVRAYSEDDRLGQQSFRTVDFDESTTL